MRLIMLLRWAQRTRVRMRLNSGLEHSKSPTAGEEE